MKKLVQQRHRKFLMSSLMRLLFFVVLGFFVISPQAYGVVNVDVMGVYSPFPDKETVGINDGFGFNAGIGIDITRLGYIAFLQARIDYSYLNFRDFLATRHLHMVSIGPRLLFGGKLPIWFIPYLEIAFQVRFLDGFVLKKEPSRYLMFFGLGTEFFLFKGLYLTLNTRYHLGEHIFFTVAGGFGYRF